MYSKEVTGKITIKYGLYCSSEWSHYCKWSSCQVSLGTFCIPFWNSFAVTAIQDHLEWQFCLQYIFSGLTLNKEDNTLYSEENRIYLVIKSDIFILLHTSQNTEIKYWGDVSIHLSWTTAKHQIIWHASRKVWDLRTRYTKYNQKLHKTNFLLIFILDFYGDFFHHQITGQIIAQLTFIFVIDMERDPSHPAKGFLTALRYVKATTKPVAFSQHSLFRQWNWMHSAVLDLFSQQVSPILSLENSFFFFSIT